MSEMGFNVLLRSNNSYRLMSALGQKRTLFQAGNYWYVPYCDFDAQPSDIADEVDYPLRLGAARAGLGVSSHGIGSKSGHPRGACYVH